MARKKREGLSRRDFIKVTGAGTAAAGFGPFFLFPEKAQAQQKTLKILQWSHFVPGYDKWFDGVYTKEWGQKNNTNVVVDHISLNEIPARAAAEVSAKKGHDLVMFLSPPAAYEKQVIDHSEIYQEVERKHGKVISLGHKSTFNPTTKKYFAFSDSYVPDPGNWRKDLWSEVGYPNGPDTYDDLRAGAKKIRDKFGNPCGLGLAQELDTSMYMRALFKESETDEVFTWDPSSNNRAMLAGKVSFVANAISITRQAEKDNPQYNPLIMLCRTPKGPVRRITAEHVMDCYVIWSFAENIAGAKKFLVDYIDNFGTAFKASEFYNFPCFPSTVPDLKQQLASDSKANPAGKYNVLGDVLDWATNIGYPGYATAGIDEVFNTWVIPTMFAKVAKDQLSAEDAAKAAETEIKRIFERRKSG